jgi:hypothetical protein
MYELRRENHLVFRWLEYNPMKISELLNIDTLDFKRHTLHKYGKLIDLEQFLIDRCENDDDLRVYVHNNILLKRLINLI